MKKCSNSTQTLRAGCSKADPQTHDRGDYNTLCSLACSIINKTERHESALWWGLCTLWFKKNAPTLADYNYDPVQSILIIFSNLFANDHKSCLVVEFSTSPHICCHYTLWNTMLYFALITLLIAKKCANFRSP